jgi:hypothetical protein
MAKKRSKLAFAANLRRLLDRKKLRKAGFSEKELEYLRKLTYTGISHYRGSQTLEKLCDFFGIRIESLWDESNEGIASEVQWKKQKQEYQARRKRLMAAPKQIAADLIAWETPRDTLEDFVWKLKSEFAALLGNRPDPFYDNPLYPVVLDAVRQELGHKIDADGTNVIRYIATQINRPLSAFTLQTRVREIVQAWRTHDKACYASIFPPSVFEVIKRLFPSEPVESEESQSPSAAIAQTMIAESSQRHIPSTTLLAQAFRDRYPEWRDIPAYHVTKASDTERADAWNRDYIANKARYDKEVQVLLTQEEDEPEPEVYSLDIRALIEMGATRRTAEDLNRIPK